MRRQTSSTAKISILWFLTGMMLLIVAVACGSLLSGAATAAAAEAGVREPAIMRIAVATLLVGFTVVFALGLRDLASLARRGQPALPARWVVGSLLALPVAGPLWNLCVVHIQERISGSDAVRISLTEHLHVLMTTNEDPPPPPDAYFERLKNLTAAQWLRYNADAR